MTRRRPTLCPAVLLLLPLLLAPATAPVEAAAELAGGWRESSLYLRFLTTPLFRRTLHYCGRAEGDPAPFGVRRRSCSRRSLAPKAVAITSSIFTADS